MIQRRLLLAGLAVLLSACVGPRFQELAPPPPDRAWVVVFRVFTLPSAARGTTLWVDGKMFGDLRVNRYTYVSVPAGTHKLHHDNEKASPENTVEFEAKPGRRYYFSYVVGAGTMGPGYLVVNRGNLRLVAVGEAPKELSEYALAPPILSSVD